MFVLSELTDTIKIEPHLFKLRLEDALSREINRKFANKVIHKVGLVICLHQLNEVLDSFVFPGDGSSHTKVRFTLVVFRPMVGECIVGKIKSCSPEGLVLSIGFFDDIHVPPQTLPHPSRFDEQEQLWIWQYESEDGSHELFMDLGETARFRVTREVFVDTAPEEEGTSSPYVLEASFADQGLGLLAWWQ